jgi:hypothetical protein
MADNTLLFKTAIGSYEDFIGSFIGSETVNSMNISVGGGSISPNIWTREIYRILLRRYRNWQIAYEHVDDFLDMLWEKIEINAPNYLAQKFYYQKLLNMTDEELLSQESRDSKFFTKAEYEHIRNLLDTLANNKIKGGGTHTTESVTGNDTERNTTNLSNKTDGTVTNILDGKQIDNKTEHPDTNAPNLNNVFQPLVNLSEQNASKVDNTNTDTSHIEVTGNTNFDKTLTKNDTINTDFTTTETEGDNGSINKTGTESNTKQQENTYNLKILGDYGARLRNQYSSLISAAVEDFLDWFKRLFIRIGSATNYWHLSGTY